MENYSLSDIAAASGGEGFGGANSWVLIILFALIFGGGGFGFGGNQAATSADVQRAVDYSALQSSISGVDSEIQRGIYEVNNNTNHVAYDNLGEIRDVEASVAAIGATMQNCCCETKNMILENRYLGAQNTAAINANTTAAMQKVLDTIQADKIASLNSQVTELKMQNMFCGVPRISPYGYGVYQLPGTTCNCNTI